MGISHRAGEPCRQAGARGGSSRALEVDAGFDLRAPLEGGHQRDHRAGSVIARDFITEWRREAPWIQDAQIEQDLVLSGALVEIFRVESMADRL